MCIVYVNVLCNLSSLIGLTFDRRGNAYEALVSIDFRGCFAGEVVS